MTTMCCSSVKVLFSGWHSIISTKCTATATSSNSQAGQPFPAKAHKWCHLLRIVELNIFNWTGSFSPVYQKYLPVRWQEPQVRLAESGSILVEWILREWAGISFRGFKILHAHATFSNITSSSFLKNDMAQCPCPTYLHGDICGLGGMAFQVFIPTATCTPHQWHTRGAVDVLHLCRVLLHHLHQLLNGPAEAATPHFLEHQH